MKTKMEGLLMAESIPSQFIVSVIDGNIEPSTWQTDASGNAPASVNW